MTAINRSAQASLVFIQSGALPPAGISPVTRRLRLVATALPARDRAVAPFDRGSDRATAGPRADGDTPWADADSIVIPPTVPVVAVVITVPADLDIDALGHPYALLGPGRSSNCNSCAQRPGRRHCESDFDHVWLSYSEIQIAKCRIAAPPPCVTPAVRAACLLGCEGIVSKRKNSPYRSGRSRDWVKRIWRRRR